MLGTSHTTLPYPTLPYPTLPSPGRPCATLSLHKMRPSLSSAPCSGWGVNAAQSVSDASIWLGCCLGSLLWIATVRKIPRERERNIKKATECARETTCHSGMQSFPARALTGVPT